MSLRKAGEAGGVKRKICIYKYSSNLKFTYFVVSPAPPAQEQLAG
jgi:hypothetical protein